MQRFMTAYFLGLDEIKVYTEEEYRKKEIEIATCDDWVWQWAKDKETAKKQHFNKLVQRLTTHRHRQDRDQGTGRR